MPTRPKGQGSVESILDEELEFRKPDDLPFNKYPMPEGQKLSQGSPDRDLMNNCIEVNAFEEPAYVDSTYARNVQRGAFGERTAAEFQCYLPPQNSIEEHLQVFFNTISMVFNIVDKSTFELEWQLFNNSPETTSVSWMALLFAILSISLRGNHHNWPMVLSLDRISVEYELRAWECLTQDHISINQCHGLKALMLIGFQRANRGLSIGCLTRMAIRISQAIYPLNDLGVYSNEQQSIWDGLVTLSSLTYQLSKAPSEEWIPITISKPRVEDMTLETFAMIHTRLDAMSSEIPKVLCSGNPHGIHELHIGLKGLQASLESQKLARQAILGSDEIHFLILEGRLHYLFYSMFSNSLPERDEPQREKCFASAKNVLSIFRELVLTYDQSIWWYLSGVGSLYAAKCALTLATYCDKDEWPMRQTLQAFSIIASQSNFCMEFMPEIHEAISFGAS